MGDYGFKGAGEYSGNEENFNSKPDYDVSNCPSRKLGLNGDADNSYSCLETGRADADHKGEGYSPCNFVGFDYRQCSRNKKEDKGDSE
jgi:hypothetical protein